MFKFFNKKEKLIIETNEQKELEPILEVVEQKQEEVTPVKDKKQEYLTNQCIEIGMDIKNDVESSSRAFFQSKNHERAKAYKLFNTYLQTLERYQVELLKNMDYLEFIEKQEQIYTRLKTGFAQFLTKGTPLEGSSKRDVELVFADIKKLPSKAHRYWYYKIYIWQGIDTNFL